MKESGINYFFDSLYLYNTGNFEILYTFENNSGANIYSIPNGKSIYTGTMIPTGAFSYTGSGLACTSGKITVANVSGVNQSVWTQVFVYESIGNQRAILFSSLTGGSGYEIGITNTNKPYLRTSNGSTVCSKQNYSAKNIVALSYANNNLDVNRFDPLNGIMERETFGHNFDISSSNSWNLVPSFTGNIDFWIYFSDYFSSNVLQSILTGICYAPRISGTDISLQYFTGIITGTGISLSYLSGIITTSAPVGGTGYALYNQAFPTGYDFSMTTGLVGVYTGLVNITGITGIQYGSGTVYSFTLDTGYAVSFGPDKISNIKPIESGDLIKYSVSRTAYDNNYNIIGDSIRSGIVSRRVIKNKNEINPFTNGVATYNTGLDFQSQKIIVTGLEIQDRFFYDYFSGSKTIKDLTGNYFEILHTGQELFINGINLISGHDFISSGAGVFLTGNATGITGKIFEYSIGLTSFTGNFNTIILNRFARNSTNLYLNGVRSVLGEGFYEGSYIDLISGNRYRGDNLPYLYYNDRLFLEN